MTIEITVNSNGVLCIKQQYFKLERSIVNTSVLVYILHSVPYHPWCDSKGIKNPTTQVATHIGQ